MELLLQLKQFVKALSHKINFRSEFSAQTIAHMLKADLADLELLGLLLLLCLPPNIMSAKGSCPPKNSAKMSSAERKWKPPKSLK